MVSLTLIVFGVLFAVAYFLFPFNPIGWLVGPYINKGKSVIEGIIRTIIFIIIIHVIGRIVGEHPVIAFLEWVNQNVVNLNELVNWLLSLVGLA